MNIKQHLPGMAALGVILSLSASQAISAEIHSVQGAPASDRGLETRMKQTVDLASEIPGMEGRQLRIRLLSIEPGGHIKLHHHKNRPAAFYVIQGATTITYADGTVKRFPAGSMGSADRNTTHWHKNNEKETTLFLAADIFQPKPN